MHLVARMFMSFQADSRVIQQQHVPFVADLTEPIREVFNRSVLDRLAAAAVVSANQSEASGF